MSSTSESLGQKHEVRFRGAPLSQGVLAGITGLLDVLAIVLPGILIHSFYVEGPTRPWTADLAAIEIFVLLFLLAMYAAGCYRFPVIVSPGQHLFRIAAICAAVFLVLVLLAFALKISTDFSRVWAFSWLISLIVLILSLRAVLAHAVRVMARAGLIGRNIVIFGGTKQGQRLLHRLAELNEPWNRVVGVFDDRLSRVGPEVAGVQVLGNLRDLVAWARSREIDEVLIALPWSAEERLVSIIGALSVLPANIRLCPEFFRAEAIHGRTSNQFGLPMLSAFEKPIAGWGAVAKRVFDVLVSATVILVAGPFLLLIAVAITLDSPGTVFFRQKRYGFNNEIIEVFKFRTMRMEASDQLGDRLTAPNDPRVTRVGAFLRRTSLDELPQILNVLKGEMSVVGPRPHAIRTTAGGRPVEEVADGYAVRHKVKPGITGWAQVNGWRGTMQDEAHLLKRVEYDLYYINNWTPWFDIKILIRTAWVVVNGRNSY